MKTTISEQITAIQKVYNGVKYNRSILDITSSNTQRAAIQKRKFTEAINDAGSTLAAVQFIGLNKIQYIDDLIKAADAVLKEFDDPVECAQAFQQLSKVLNQIKQK